MSRYSHHVLVKLSLMLMDSSYCPRCVPQCSAQIPFKPGAALLIQMPPHFHLAATAHQLE